MSDLLRSGRLVGLAVGLVLGLVAAGVCLACWAWRRRPGVPTPLVGLALAAASAAGIALTATVRPPATLIPGLAALAGAGAALERARAAGAAAPGVAARVLWLAGAVLLAAGAALVTWRLALDQGAALGLVVAVGTCAVAAALADFDRRWQRSGLVPVLLAVTAAGVYATVPDVEGAVVVLGVALPLCLLGWPGPLAWSRARPPPSLGTVGALPAAGLLVWTVAAGGSARPGSVVGGLACLGVLAVEPVARRLDPRRRGPAGVPGRPGRAAWWVLAAQVLLAGAASRVVGRQATVALALALAALELVLALAAAMLATRLQATGSRAGR
jgi:hypothetical protein